MLQTLVPLLAAAVIAVPVSRRLGLGSIVGYLVAGVLIGPDGLRLVTDVAQIAGVAELGVVMLLFLIGLELRPHRLWVLRKAVFGLGLGQVVPSALLLAAAMTLAGVPAEGAVVLGTGLAFSSTAIVLPMLTERGLLSSAAGRDAFAVLLFQDIAFIPVVAVLPLLTPHGAAAAAWHVPWFKIVRAIGVIAAILLGGARLVPRVFRKLGGAKTPEVFTAVTLLLVAGTAALADWAGLSMSLGAFLAGVVLSDSDYRHELQANVEPFEGLLLGFFFTSVGMAADLTLAIHRPAMILGGVAALLAVKTAVGFVLGLIKRRNLASGVRLAMALPAGSEFSFVLFGAAVSTGALARAQADAATLVVAVSMLLTPLLFAAGERFVVPRLSKPKEPVYDAIDDGVTPVIICGFGRVGQIVGRILALQKIPFTALEKDEAQLEVLRRFGTKVFFGDAARPEVLRAAGGDTAKLLVVAVDGVEDSLRVVQLARRYHPNLRVYARARNRNHAHRLMDLNVDGLVRETYFSSLRLAEVVLGGLDLSPATARRTVQLFRERDERALEESHAYANDESALIQSGQQVAAELQGILEADQARQTEHDLRLAQARANADDGMPA
jgi:CPA2 family monovalent cation:H+ antiporter-2/glutathione-regulated potassium-efflux system protein KefB